MIIARNIIESNSVKSLTWKHTIKKHCKAEEFEELIPVTVATI